MGNNVKKTVFGLCAVTTALYGINQLIFKSAVRKELLDKNNGKYFKTEYGNMFYKVSGEGQPILLVHDISCASSGYEWSSIVKELSKNYKVYVIDLIGCGRSEKPNFSYTSYFYIKILADFIRNVVKEKTNIVATGKSAAMVPLLDKFDDSLIDKVVAVSPEYIGTSNYDRIGLCGGLKKKLLLSPVFGTACYNMAVSKNLIEEKFEEDYFFEKSKIKNVLINAYYESAHLGGANSKFLYMSLYNNYLCCNPLNSISNFTSDNFLIIFGNENKMKYKIYKQYKSHNKDISLKIVQNSKLLPQLEQPKEVVDLIKTFIS